MKEITITATLKKSSKIYKDDRCLVLDRNREIIINSIRNYVRNEIKSSKNENVAWKLQANFQAFNSDHGRSVIFNNLKLNFLKNMKLLLCIVIILKDFMNCLVMNF